MLIPDYRGCGISEGERDERHSGTVAEKDSSAIYDWVSEFYGDKPKHIMTHGRSLGGGYSCMLGAQHQVPAILDHTFSTPVKSIVNMAKILSESQAQALLKYSLAPGEDEKWDNVKRIQGGEFPIFIIEGKKDSLMRGSAKELNQAAGNRAFGWLKVEGGHGWVMKEDTYETYKPRLSDAIRQAATAGKKMLGIET